MINALLWTSCRGLSTTGKKQELVVLAFSAIELNLPLVPSSVEIEKSILDTYKRLHTVGDVNLPNPLLISRHV